MMCGAPGRSRIGDACIESESDGIEVGIGIAKDLVEVADTHGELIGHRWQREAVVDNRVVLNVDGRVLKVRGQLRRGWRSLRTLPTNHRAEI
jgi:hypothetical protein